MRGAVGKGCRMRGSERECEARCMQTKPPPAAPSGGLDAEQPLLGANPPEKPPITTLRGSAHLLGVKVAQTAACCDGVEFLDEVSLRPQQLTLDD